MTEEEVRQFLRDKIEVEYGSQACFADAIGISPPMVCMFLSGQKRPGPKILQALGLVRETTCIYRRGELASDV